jgi:tripartite ATP-independent transporter DctP family solute receptor
MAKLGKKFKRRIHMKSKLSLILLTLVLAVSLVLANPHTFAAQTPTTLTFAHIFENGQPIFTAAETIARDFEKATKGRYKIKVVPSGALGNMKANLEGLSLGSLDITIAGVSYLADAYQPITLGAAPYAFKSWDHLNNYFQSSLFKKFKKAYTKITGIQIVGSFSSGFRNVTANKPVRTPADMKGLKIRVPDAPLFLAMPRAVGANPTPVNFGEVYLALQQGIVDAEENPLTTIYSMKFHEVQKYICLTQHMMEPAHILVSPITWKKLAANDRKILTGITEKAGIKISKESMRQEQELIQKFKQAGNLIITDVDRKAFRKACEQFNLDSGRPWTPQQYRRLQALQ